MAMSARTQAEITFTARAGRPPQGIVFAPGRLVLLGEHVDHQGGRVLAVPLRRGVYVAYAVRPDRRVNLVATNAGGTDVFTQDQWTPSGRRWADLARGACARLGRGSRLPGLDLVVTGDLPPRKGMASSAAYVVGILQATLAATGRERSVADLARDGAAVEAEWAGVPCGPMDTYVAATGRPGEVLYIDCEALTHETLRLPEGTTLLEEDTMVERRLSESPYARRLAELEQALAEVRRARPSVTRLVDLSPAEFEALAPGLSEPGVRRARHVVTEIDRVHRAAEALKAGDAGTVGRLMVEGHASLARDFECSLPSIDARVEEILGRPGVLGARLQGAGWGGTIAVFRRILGGDGRR